MAGARPNSTPVATATANANSMAVPSMRGASSAGNENGGIKLSIHFIVAKPTPMPTMPPQMAIKTFSVRNWRAKRQRLAPSAARTAISRSRATPRASARLARFAQPIRTTNAVAANMTSTAVRNCGPPMTSSARSTPTLQPCLIAGYSAAIRLPMTSISARACSSVTPGLSFAKTPNQ